jgi:arsenate reductase (glutaredoxin)
VTYLGSRKDVLEAVRYDGVLRLLVEADLQRLQARADRIVEAHRDAIVAVARALQGRRHLTGDAVRVIFDAHRPVPVRALLCEKGTPFKELGVDDPEWADDDLVDFLVKHPILINRPIVVTPKGVKLCRPSEPVLELLPNPHIGCFVKEDGEVVDAAQGLHSWIRHVGFIRATTALPSWAMCGRLRVGKENLHLRRWSEQPCVRPDRPALH